ncbi:hypothetical protein ES707_22393 [subsurface metagenome]
MTVGMEDYLSINRPKYGAADSKIGVVEVNAGEETEIISVVGRGVIYGGVLHLTYDSEQDNSMPVLEVDGKNIATLNFFTLNIYHLIVPGSYPFYLLYYDWITPRYAIGISGGITFEKGFRVLYREDYTKTPYVTCRAIYALL